MKNVLNYFVRKAFGFKSTATAEDKTLFGHLLRIRQNIQGVYDWLYARCPADAWWLARRMPMTEAVSADGHEVHIAKAWNSDNLLAHLRLLDGRKISNGYADGTPADDGLPDGVSLARLLCDSTTQPTALIDDNIGWDYANGKSLATKNWRKVVLNCKRIGGYDYTYQEWFPSSVEELEMPYLERFEGSAYIGFPSVNPNYKVWHFPKLKYSRMSFSHSHNSLDDYVNDWTEEIIMPEMVEFGGYASNICLCNFTALRKLVLGMPYTYSTMWLKGDTNLLHLEFTKKVNVNTNLSNWSPTLDSSNLSLFLDNFLHFIAERVAEGNYTLTLSAAVYAALEQQEGQTILALLNTKGWTVASA